MTGKSGEDRVIRVPLGTVVRDLEADELVGEVTGHGQRLLVAQGGKGGLGNLHFKSSTNRAPRQTVPGEKGQVRMLQLELKVLADVGLLGFPNAGKSTLISTVSAARPKVADYPFTTLYPNLGVVSVGVDQNFVIADIPGIIEGAAEGAGLGIQFLKHLQRTRLLLHLVDIAPLDGKRPAEAVRELQAELLNYDAALADKPQWLVFTKADLLEPDDALQRAEAAVEELGHTDHWALISSVSHAGTEALMQDIMQALEQMREPVEPETMDYTPLPEEPPEA